MERRQSPRTNTKQEAWLRWLDAVSDLSEAPPARCPALMQDVSARGARFLVPHPYPVGAAMEVLVNDELWLGEVVWRAGTNGGYLIGVEVEQRLLRLTDVENLCRRLLPDARRSEAADGGFSGEGTEAQPRVQQSAFR
ncbi:MAG: PilZ domain-containing protein [Bryobacteraceae bacterium]|nr:PilZ domain-containing protein [Bryobacteraceae bacterium]